MLGKKLLTLMALTAALANAFIRIFLEKVGIVAGEFACSKLPLYSCINCLTECLRSSLNQVSGLIQSQFLLLQMDRAFNEDAYGDFGPFLHSKGDLFT